jgi:hypothetical protein
MAAEPLADPVDEALHLTDAGREQGVALRITGGVAVALRCESSRRPPLERRYADIDCVAPGRQGRALTDMLAALGYRPDEAFNAVNGATRLFFWDRANERQLDVFLDRVEMCHTFDLRDRLDVHDRTLSLADLLLLKLQVVETNEKDFLDILALLTDTPLTRDERGINLDYITGLTSADWGLWRTTTMVAERADRFAAELDGFAGRERVREQVRAYLDAVAEAPKSRGWKLRARLGDRKRWYELPEEAHA